VAKYLPETDENLARIFAESISYAIGDGIEEDVQSKELVTRNGDPSRIWDILHTNLVNSLHGLSVIAAPTKRGGWAILPIVDLKSGVLYCCMRENNFKLLSKRKLDKKRQHYLYALAEAFNCDLPFLQGKLFSSEETNQDKIIVENAICRITADLGISRGIVHRHALVLFHSYDAQLVSLRCCAINSQFEIVEPVDWSQFIPVTESIIPETSDAIENSKSKLPDPVLKDKSRERIAKRGVVPLQRTKKEDHANQE